MSNERERLAREWAEIKLAMPTGHLDADVIAAAEHILATTTDPLTMADVEWDDEKHRLAGADWDGAPIVMLDTAEDATIYALEVSGKSMWEILRSRLAPNGKRYRLVEVTGDEHPETLTTVEDYENAPAGTVVAAAPRYRSMPLPMMKEADGIWVMLKSARGRFNEHMAGTERRVLRKGWGE